MRLFTNADFCSFVYFITISCFLHVQSSRVSIQDNGYTHVTVSLPDNFPLENRAVLIQSVKNLFEFSSRILYIATKRRSYFKEIIVICPSSWDIDGLNDLRSNTSFEETNGGQESRRIADVEVSDELLRSQPYTVQAEGCGKQGAKIYLPTQFLLSDKSLREKSVEFIHNWAQFRYGVYPEGGFAYDERYPLYFSIPGTTDIQTTACTNTPIDYNFTDSYGEECLPQVNEQTGKPITLECILQSNKPSVLSSIMNQHALPNVTEFCDSDISLDKSHNYHSLSKHNVLCSEDSPWFILMRHPDFAKGRNQASRFKPQDTTIRYMHEKKFRIVIAIENTVNMLFMNQRHLLQNALSKFVLLDLPLGTEIGIVYFDTKANSGTMMKLTDDKAKQEFVESELYQDGNVLAGSCTDCGITTAIELLHDESRNGLLILITTNTTVENSENLADRLRAGRIRFSVIVLPTPHKRKKQTLASLEQLSQQNEGRLFHLSENEENTMLSQLYMSLLQAISHFENINVLLLERLSPENTEVTIAFHVYDSAAQNFNFLITSPTFRAEDSPFEEDETFLMTPSGIPVALKKHYNIPAWVYSTRTAEIGKYVFVAKWKKDIAEPVFSIAFGKPSDQGSAINVRIWTSSSEAMESRHHSPTKLYAEIRSSVHPMINANVIATVFESKGTNVSTFRLLDSGLGDPDITSKDGIYSRYIPPLGMPGTYNIFIRVTDNSNRSRISFISSEVCCGSYIQSKKTQPTGKFQTVSGPLSIHINNASTEDVHPPNKVLDVTVMGINMENRTYTLSWTSAGDNYDHGAAEAYNLKLFLSRSEARWRFDETGTCLEYNKEIIQHTLSNGHGSRQNYVIQLPDTLDTSYYFIALKAIDQRNNSSPLSNIVEIYLRNDLRNRTVVCETNSNDGNSALHLRSNSFFFILCYILFDFFRIWYNWIL